MFSIVQSDTYKWPVEIKYPIDNGRTAKETFDGVFKRLTQTRLDEIKKQAKSDEGLLDRDLAREVLVGWDGITDASGEKIPYSDTVRDELLDKPLVASAIVMAFMESYSGARRKN